jgi:metal-responsive CopG/Arc/MetJ family transcriptional regulator
MTKYRTVKLPNNLIESVKQLLEEHEDLGYRSHSEFIIEATRRRLEEIKKHLLNSKTLN